MIDEKNKKGFKLHITKLKKENWEGDKVLKFAVIVVIVLFIIGAIIVGLRMLNPRVDATEGQEKLAKLEEANVQTIDSQIQELEASEAEETAAWKAKSASEKLEGCIVLGDSTARGFSQNNVLSKALIEGSENAAVYNAEGTGLSDLIESTISAEPEKIFLYLGRADAMNGNESADEFASNYQVIIQQLKTALPKTTIYVCSVPEARNTSAASIPSEDKEETTSTSESNTVDFSRYKVISSYNDALQTMCQTEHVKYIDNTELKGEEYYADDGVTLTKAYYEACINHIVEVAFRRYVI